MIRRSYICFLFMIIVLSIVSYSALAEYDEIMIGDHVLLGSMEIDGNTDNGKEPLSWSVLDVNNDYCLLITDRIIDRKVYNSTIDFNINWANSEIRTWLNNDLFNEIFTSSEQDIIVPISIHGESPSGGYDVVDRIFLLSKEEADYYFCKEVRVIPAIHNNSFFDNQEYKEDWWLRVQGNGTRVYKAGKNITLEDMDECLGVRPAILALKSKITVRPLQLPERDEYKNLIIRQISNHEPTVYLYKAKYLLEQYFAEHYDIVLRKKIRRSSRYSYDLLSSSTGEVLSFSEEASYVDVSTYSISFVSDVNATYNSDIANGWEKTDAKSAVDAFFR